MAHDTINTAEEFDIRLKQGAYAWPGGYPLFFITSDGEPLSFKAAEQEAEQIRRSITENARDGWRVIGVAINWEDGDLYCAHTDERIECAYPGDDNG